MEACEKSPLNLADMVTFQEGQLIFKNIDCLLCNEKFLEVLAVFRVMNTWFVWLVSLFPLSTLTAADCGLLNSRNVGGVLTHGGRSGAEQTFADDHICNTHNFPRTPPFQFLFGSNQNPPPSPTEDLSQSQKCKDSEWRDPQGVCRKVSCAEGKELSENGMRCVTSLPQITGLPYVIRMWMVAKQSTVTSLPTQTVAEDQDTTLATPVVVALKNRMQDFSDNFHIKVRLRLLRQNVSSLSCGAPCSYNNSTDMPEMSDVMAPELGSFEIHFIPFRALLRDQLEPDLVDIFYNQTFNVESNGVLTQFDLTFIPDFFPSEITDCQNEISYRCIHSFDYYLSSKRFGDWEMEKSEFISIHPTLLCPFLEIDETLEIVISFSEIPSLTKVAFKLDQEDHRLELTGSSEIHDINFSVGKVVNVCIRMLDSKLSQAIAEGELDVMMVKDVQEEKEDEVGSSFVGQYVLTVVCVSVSLVCLTITVVTYCLFPCLRTLAGCNTLGLCTSLAVAQVFLMVASHTEGPSPVCTVVGLVNHFCWLSMFTWSFLCCLHMMRVFTSNVGRHQGTSRTGMKGRQEKRSVLTNVLLSVCVPSVVVVTVVLASYIQSGGHTLGYGHTVCSTDYPLSIQVPLVVLVSTNILFFLTVVVKIWRLRRDQSGTAVTTGNFRKDDRKDLVVYVNLSTLTGMFWLLAVLAELFHSDTLRFLAILLNGSQGVFIFASFIVNRRVWALYVKRFGGGPLLPASSSPMTTAKHSHSHDSSNCKTTTVDNVTEK